MRKLRVKFKGKGEFNRKYTYNVLDVSYGAYLLLESCEGQHRYMVIDISDEVANFPISKTEFSKVNMMKFRVFNQAKEEFDLRTQKEIEQKRLNRTRLFKGEIN